MNTSHFNRRDFIKASTAAAFGLGIPGTSLGSEAAGGPRISGKAEHIIYIWLSGGMGQIDTFDPKRLGDPAKKQAGSLYPTIKTAVQGVEVCEHLKHTAPLMDRMTAVRSLYHDVINEHAAATNRMHTGRPVSGTVTYPAIGSIVAHELGAVVEDVPPYVLIGYPNVTRGPGFLGSKAGYLYLTKTSEGPAGLSRPDYISADRQSRREDYLADLRKNLSGKENPRIHSYDDAVSASLKLSGPDFNQVFDLEREPAELRLKYGGEFGQRCLLSRRLVERGVRFIEVSHNLNFLNGAGWDVHNNGILQQHQLISELDIAMSALMQDLEEKKLLDKTLIVVSTEFGRPPEFDSGGGRGHQSSAFTCVMAGGGLKHRGAWGETDEFSRKVTGNPVSVPDFFATMLAAVGIDYGKTLYDRDRPIPITDMGKPIRELFV